MASFPCNSEHSRGGYSASGVTIGILLAGDRDRIKRLRIDQGRDPQAAADDAREILDFYQLGPDCLWIIRPGSPLVDVRRS
jgi:hypothetical protein